MQIQNLLLITTGYSCQCKQKLLINFILLVTCYLNDYSGTIGGAIQPQIAPALLTRQRR
jgi:hypothetical protein